MHACMHACMHVCVHVRMVKGLCAQVVFRDTYIHTYIHVYMCAKKQLALLSILCVSAFVYVCLCVHTLICTHINIHIQIGGYHRDHVHSHVCINMHINSDT